MPGAMDHHARNIRYERLQRRACVIVVVFAVQRELNETADRVANLLRLM